MSTNATESLVGSFLDGRYRVLSRIAEGGMATVYRALDTRLEREIALKVMRAGLAQDEQFVARFRREARSAARLSHPNIVAVFDQGEDDGRAFLAMELVPGKTLRDVIQQDAPLTPRAALDIMDPVLQALAAAHAAGIIHRDVKPENVILREDGMVKVADFGLARAVTNETTSAQTGVLLGTVAYLSPEQVERGSADARSDVYAAGLILFEMLTGAKAFTGDTPIHVAYQHVHSSVPVPSARVPSLPQPLDGLVAHASAREPEARPADASGFLVELRRVRSGLTPAELDVRPTGDQARRESDTVSDAGATTALGPPGADASDSTDGAASADGRGGATTAVTHLPGQLPGVGEELLPFDRALVHVQGDPTSVVPTGLDPADGPPLPPIQYNRRRRWPLVTALVLALALVGAGIWYFLAGPGAPTNVPSLEGQAFTSAERLLDQNHLDAQRVDAFSETVPKDTVISSEPGAGVELDRGSDVEVTVSKGPERYPVPKIIGSTVTEAQARLADTKLQLGKQTKAYSLNFPAGQIVATTPAEGESLKPGTSVAVVVSAGKQPIEVPDFTGQPADQAVADLTAKGLKVDATQQEFSTTVAKGAVISQSPRDGTVFRGDAVKLVVSKGPEMVTVPDLTGKPSAEARQIVEGLGLKYEEQRFPAGDSVRQQDPAPNTSVPKGSTVRVFIAI